MYSYPCRQGYHEGVTVSDDPAREANPAQVAARLRTVVGNLVRAARGGDTLAPIPAAVMDLLDREGALTTADLAARRRVRHQTMAVTVTDLRNLGYVDAGPHPVDGRKKVLNLTADGRSALNYDRKGRVKRLSDAVATLSDEEVGTLADALELIERVTAAITGDVSSARSGKPPVPGDW